MIVSLPWARSKLSLKEWNWNLSNMNKVVLMSIVVITCLNLSAQPSSWINAGSRQIKYPSNIYYTGFSERKFENKEKPQEVIEKLKESAASSISSSILINIRSVTASKTEESNKVFNDHFRKTIISSSDVDLSGLQYLTHIDDKQCVVYVLGYVEKQQLRKYYSQKIRFKITELEVTINGAESFYSTKNVKLTKIEFSKALSMANDCISLQSAMSAINNSSEEDFQADTLNTLIKRLNTLLLKIESGKNRSMNDLASVIADDLSAALPTGANVKMTYPVFADTRFVSPFSKQFTTILRTELVSKKMIIVEKGNHSSLILNGSYWDEGEKIRLFITVFDNHSTTLAATQGFMEKRYLIDNNISYIAENFAEAYSRMQEFRKDEIIGGQIKAEIWTNHENLLFQNGDTMKLSIRVNTPSYLRAIYYSADSSKILLLDNYYIDQSKVNKLVEIPNHFVCAKPFGFETLQLSAGTKMFPALIVENINGFKFIKENVNSIVRKTRSFYEASEPVENQISEVLLNITTYK